MLADAASVKSGIRGPEKVFIVRFGSTFCNFGLICLRMLIDNHFLPVCALAVVASKSKF